MHGGQLCEVGSLTWTSRLVFSVRSQRERKDHGVKKNTEDKEVGVRGSYASYALCQASLLRSLTSYIQFSGVGVGQSQWEANKAMNTEETQEVSRVSQASTWRKHRRSHMCHRQTHGGHTGDLTCVTGKHMEETEISRVSQAHALLSWN